MKMESMVKELEKKKESKKLEGDVCQWLFIDIDESDSYDEKYDKIKCKFEDLLSHGCVSGMVSHLIYYNDTVEYYEKHEDEIWELLEEEKDNYGNDSILETIMTFTDADKINSLVQFKNLLVWFAFENIAYKLYNEFVVEEQ